jgi:hypothetical protein
MVGRREPVGRLVGTLNPQERSDPVFTPPRLLLGLEGRQRGGQRRVELAAGGGKRVAVGRHRGGDHHGVSGWSLLGEDHGRRLRPGVAALWHEGPGSQHHRRYPVLLSVDFVIKDRRDSNAEPSAREAEGAIAQSETGVRLGARDESRGASSGASSGALQLAAYGANLYQFAPS